MTQLRVLGDLAEQDGMGNAELAERLGASRQSVSFLLERLERRGFIRREISLADRRGIRIHLEPTGRDAISLENDELRLEAAGLLMGLTEEQLERVTNAFAPLAPQRPLRMARRFASGFFSPPNRIRAPRPGPAPPR